jgi:hypothetical protein
LKDKSGVVEKTYLCVTGSAPPLGPLIHHLKGQLSWGFP